MVRIRGEEEGERGLRQRQRWWRSAAEATGFAGVADWRAEVGWLSEENQSKQVRLWRGNSRERRMRVEQESDLINL